AFDRWIGRGCAGYVPRDRFSPVQAVHLIRSGGGVPVLAHPGMGGADHLIPELVRAGLQGLEVHHPEHGSEDVAHYAAVAEKFRLVATGGSDFHGHASHARLGAVVVPLQVVDDLKLRQT
ncbi:MAG: phosphatase, partial [Candidatus Desulforudis sp.]|nr:phosphatase [Desulforudis sp.]